MTTSPQTFVVKIGTTSLTNHQTRQLSLSTIGALVETLTHLRTQGNRIVLVSSGAVGIGCARLNLTQRPQKLAIKQAVAAVGQGRLIRVYDDLFTTLGQPIAQVLLTRRELVERGCYVNVSNTLESLLELGVIPIVNENDTVAVEELNFGDNDTLSALVASLIKANWLFLLTDVDRLYSADPRLVPDALPISQVKPEELEELQAIAGQSGSAWGTGGMATKLTAARLATSAGVRVAITQGKAPDNIRRILQGEAIGTQFQARPPTDNARKRWIAYGLVPSGKLILDQGAVNAICSQGKSLLAAGIIDLEGEFSATDSVSICDLAGNEVGKGLVNYSHSEIEQIKGKKSQMIPVLLGYAGVETVIHRDNLMINDFVKSVNVDVV